MRLPNRKPGKYTFPTFDPHITVQQLDALKKKLDRILKVTRPQAIRQVQEYAQNGDFSENAEYQIAKGRLRGLNRAIDEMQHQITHAILIDAPKDAHTIAIGHTVTVRMNGSEQQFTILGSTESNPSKGIISYQSPLGAALLGHAVGEKVHVDIAERDIICEILSIE